MKINSKNNLITNCCSILISNDFPKTKSRLIMLNCLMYTFHGVLALRLLQTQCALLLHWWYSSCSKTNNLQQVWFNFTFMIRKSVFCQLYVCFIYLMEEVFFWKFGLFLNISLKFLRTTSRLVLIFEGRNWRIVVISKLCFFTFESYNYFFHRCINNLRHAHLNECSFLQFVLLFNNS